MQLCLVHSLSVKPYMHTCSLQSTFIIIKIFLPVHRLLVLLLNMFLLLLLILFVCYLGWWSCIWNMWSYWFRKGSSVLIGNISYCWSSGAAISRSIWSTCKLCWGSFRNSGLLLSYSLYSCKPDALHPRLLCPFLFHCIGICVALSYF